MDRSYGFSWNTDYTQYVSRERKEADRWGPMRDGVEPGMVFWYRGSDVPLVADRLRRRQPVGRPGHRVGSSARPGR